MKVLSLIYSAIPCIQFLVKHFIQPIYSYYWDHNGSSLRYWFVGLPVESQYSPDILLNVVGELSNKFVITRRWLIITPPIINESAIEGTSFTTPLTITGDPFPVSSNIVITGDGVSVQDGRITVNIGSVMEHLALQ